MEPKYFDPDALYNLLGDDKNTIIKMLENILKGAARKHESLNANLELEDWNLVKGDAHFLKSNFRYLGASEMSSLLKKIEIIAMEEGDKTTIPAMVLEFNQNYPVIIKEVGDYITYLRNSILESVLQTK